MVSEERSLHRILKALSSSKELILALFLIPAVAIFVNIEINALNLAYFIATEMILAHMIYGGYVVLRRQEEVSLLSYGLAFTVWLCLLFLFGKWVDTATQWFISLIVVFTIAILFHFHIRRRTKKRRLKNFCKYKISIELWGILLGWLGIVFTKLFQKDTLFGIMNLIIILVANYIIFFRKKAYKKLDEPS